MAKLSYCVITIFDLGNIAKKSDLIEEEPTSPHADAGYKLYYEFEIIGDSKEGKQKHLS